MKISILSPDLSGNCLGRSYLLAKILQRQYEVEIVGPIFSNGIWEPVIDDKSIPYKSVKIRGRFKPYCQIKELAKKIDGDVVYASKPVFTSFGVGLLKKLFTDKPLILDIDDWEMGFIKENYSRLSFAARFKSLAASTLYLYTIGSYWSGLLGEKLVCFADEIIVSNRFLQRKFSGTIVWHGRDTEAFDPTRCDGNSIREKYRIEGNKKVVMFFGTPRPHKGIDDLIKAVSIIEDRNVILVNVGVADRDQYSQKAVEAARKALNKRFKGFGLQPFERVPEILSMANVVVIPQRKNLATLGQVPAKVFDAMAMAKPIIATNVSGLPEILDGCGWIVEPENPEQLAEKIQYVLDNPEEAKAMGNEARQRCIEKYSWDVMEEILLKVFEKYK
jgi:glycosyltransferase involved in cell wall biosynthesis